jgi:hypothetical protein
MRQNLLQQHPCGADAARRASTAALLDAQPKEMHTNSTPLGHVFTLQTQMQVQAEIHVTEVYQVTSMPPHAPQCKSALFLLLRVYLERMLSYMTSAEWGSRVHGASSGPTEVLLYNP